jgi:tetratricopeptide (TPR) repeat protein
VRVAQAAEFSRVEFHWAGGARAAVKRSGQTLTLRFNRAVKPDVSQLKVFPPRFLKSAEAAVVGGAAQVTFILGDDADAKVGQADGATYVNFFAQKADAKTKADPKAKDVKPDPKAAAEPAAPQSTPIAADRPNPIPTGGIVHAEGDIFTGRTVLRFPWKAPLGAAVFRRGEAVWIVFDAKAGMDLGKLPQASAQLNSVRLVQGADFTALRLETPPGVPVTTKGEGGTWSITLGRATDEPPTPIKVSRDPEQASAALSAAVAGVTRVIWFDDPVVGDRIAAVPALAPSKGLPSRREFVDMALLPSAQGLGVEPYASDLAISSQGELVKIGRPSGLALSSTQKVAAANPALSGAPQKASMPALIDSETWSKVGSGGFFARYDALQAAAADERMKDVDPEKNSPVEARMALARFLVGSDLSYEAIGALNALGRKHPAVMADAEFRGLRGAAKVMAGRYAEASVDLAAPQLAHDPSAALWRGYIAERSGRFDEARKAYSEGYQALNLVAPKWRSRFARSDATAALETNQLGVARTQIAMALSADAGPYEELAVRLVQARLFEAEHDTGRAIAVYDAVATVRLGSLAAPAILHATELRLASGKITPQAAADVYDNLRYRWRGDATELETVRALGALYVSLGRYREALTALRSAGQRLPDLPQATLLQADLNQDFRSLFLEGGADGMEPLQAMSLFFDFQELTPPGAEGDQMVRKLARRLVDVDLLDDAAKLLKYQVENRLDGVPKAQVATDLATIYLMNQKPEDALYAINESRTTVLPTAMNVQRRLLAARALLALGHFDEALEFIQADKSAEANDLRADITWKQKNWAASGPLFEKSLGDRWKNEAPLTPAEEAKLLRASVAYSLAGDDAALTRLRTRYAGYIDQARSPDALRVALAGADAIKLPAADFARISADNDSFTAWVIKMKQKLRSDPLKPAPPKQAAAAAPAKG